MPMPGRSIPVHENRDLGFRAILETHGEPAGNYEC